MDKDRPSEEDYKYLLREMKMAALKIHENLLEFDWDRSHRGPESEFYKNPNIRLKYNKIRQFIRTDLQELMDKLEVGNYWEGGKMDNKEINKTVGAIRNLLAQTTKFLDYLYRCSEELDRPLWSTNPKEITIRQQALWGKVDDLQEEMKEVGKRLAKVEKAVVERINSEFTGPK